MSVISKVEVDTPTCIGCGTCWVSCPDTFREVEVGEDFKAAATDVVGDQRVLHSAAVACPSLSIFLYDADGGVIYPTEVQREELRRAQQW